MSIYLLRLKQSLIFCRFMYYILTSLCTRTCTAPKWLRTDLLHYHFWRWQRFYSVIVWHSSVLLRSQWLFLFIDFQSCSLILNVTKLTLVIVVNWIIFFFFSINQCSWKLATEISINEPLAHDEYFHPFLWNLINFQTCTTNWGQTKSL